VNQKNIRLLRVD